MIKNWIQKNWLCISIFFIFIIFSISRLYVFGNHFTHYDDIYSPYLIQVISNYDSEYFIYQIEQYGSFLSEEYKDWLISIFLYDTNIFEFVKRMIGAMSVSLTSTYAPMQFFFTALILDFNYEYEKFIKIMRLPSLIFGFLSFIGFIFYAHLFSREEKNILTISGLTLLTISWMSIVYSAQSQNFILGLFCIILLFYLIQKVSSRSITFKESIFLGIFLSFLSLCHYQVIFYLPGFYIGYICSTHKKFFLQRAISLIPSLIINLFTVFLIFLLLIGDRAGTDPGFGWNAGLNKEFAWSSVSFSSGLYDGLIYTLDFILVNSVKVLYGLFGFRESLDVLSIIHASIILFFVILGIFSLRKLPKYRALFIFILTTTAFWAYLILSNQISYSPSRHSIALIPIFITLFSFGLIRFFNILNLSVQAKNTYVLIFAFISLLGFAESFQSIKNQRSNPFLNDVDIIGLIDKYSVTQIAAYGHTADLNFFPIINQKYSKHWSDSLPYTHVFTKKEKNPEKENAIMIVCANSVQCGLPKNEILALKELDTAKYNSIANQKPLFEYSMDSNTTNCFSNMAGLDNGTRRIFLKIFPY